MKRGQTIVGEREKVVKASERMEERKKQKRKKDLRLGVVIAVIIVVIAVIAVGWKMVSDNQKTAEPAKKVVEPKALVVDESGLNKVSGATKEYIALIEGDLAEKGYTLMRATLASGMMRTIYLDVENIPYYFKISTERGAAVEAEDIDRMVRYLKENNITPSEYVDVRVERKAYYK
jgi:hypothetical protein